MKSVQDALASTGIPAFSQIWQSTGDHQDLPDQYYAYSYLTVPEWMQDDVVTGYATYLYLNLWSAGDPTEAIRKTRQAMQAAGWWMEEETTKGYKQPAYNEMVNMYCVSWTWKIIEGDS